MQILCPLEDIVFALRGELASKHGRSAAVNDYYVHLMNYWGMIEDRYESDVADDVKLLCEGYAAGINKYLQDNPSLKKRSFDPDQKNVFLEKDYLGGIYLFLPHIPRKEVLHRLQHLIRIYLLSFPNSS